MVKVLGSIPGTGVQSHCSCIELLSAMHGVQGCTRSSVDRGGEFERVEWFGNFTANVKGMGPNFGTARMSSVNISI